MSPTAVLPWREPKAGGDLPAVGELLAIVDPGGEGCSGQRAVAWQRGYEDVVPAQGWEGSRILVISSNTTNQPRATCKYSAIRTTKL